MDRTRARAAPYARRAGRRNPAADRRRAHRRRRCRRTRPPLRRAARHHRRRRHQDAAGPRRQEGAASMKAVDPPLAMLAELTHRCPLRCPYCSNPLELSRASAELGTEGWKRVLDEAAALGVLQVHFSGGEPLARRDLADLVRHAAEVGLYGNLITSGIGLDAGRLAKLVEAGLAHVQLSFQDADMVAGDRIAGLLGSQDAKRRAARLVREAGLPLTVNAVVHRQNLDRLRGMLRNCVARWASPPPSPSQTCFTV